MGGGGSSLINIFLSIHLHVIKTNFHAISPAIGPIFVHNLFRCLPQEEEAVSVCLNCINIG